MSEVFHLAEMSTSSITDGARYRHQDGRTASSRQYRTPWSPSATSNGCNARGRKCTPSRPCFPEDFRIFIVPSLPFGVTDFAAGFHGAIGLTAKTFECVINELVSALLDDGFDHVSLINHHLDPNHLKALQRALNHLGETYGCIGYLIRRY